MQTKLSKTIHLSKFNGQTHEIIFAIQYSVMFNPFIRGAEFHTFITPTLFCNVRKSIVNDDQFVSSPFVDQLIADDIQSTDWMAEFKTQHPSDHMEFLDIQSKPGHRSVSSMANDDDHDANRERDDDRFMDQLNDHFNTENL